MNVKMGHLEFVVQSQENLTLIFRNGMTRNLIVNLFFRSQDMNSVALFRNYVFSFMNRKEFLGLGNVPFCLSFSELAN